MRIYQMTATFGKLEHATWKLEPGLNIVQAPNEWGKSTWCAFLAAMFYGMDTRAKSTKTALADKERYAPWSGSPMAGRIDLCWQGRDITIERTTRRRVPLGEFRAYETETGISVPELTAANCGEKLLGVEQSVFRRAGFIRLADMPVTQDEALRNRLNALVTTGDESGAAERLEQELKELKNRVRYHKNGLLPQAQEQLQQLEDALREMSTLEERTASCRQRLQQLEAEHQQLENHGEVLRSQAARQQLRHLEEAQASLAAAEGELRQLEQKIEKLPPRKLAQLRLQELEDFKEQQNAAELEAQLLPWEPEPLRIPPVYRDADKLAADQREYERLSRQNFAAVWVLAFLSAVLAGVLIWQKLMAPGLGAAAAAVIAAVIALALGGKRRKGLRILRERYSGADPAAWQREWEAWQAAKQTHQQRQTEYLTRRGELNARLEALQIQRDSLCGGQEPEQVEALWQQILEQWEEFAAAQQRLQRCRDRCDTLRPLVPRELPQLREDTLTWTKEQTSQLLQENRSQQQRLQHRLGQLQSSMEALGSRDGLQQKKEAATKRVNDLMDMYAALTIAQEALTQANRNLQRRFAPRITCRAREFLREMTGGRYDRLNMGEDLGLAVATEEDDTLRSSQWRSDGTVDQLYLALRLAVAEELTPESPLILDDALVRFDDDRLAAALRLLKQQAENRQVILFTCQSREKNLIQ